ncbi:MAG: DedA family protein [Oligoflexia bacterium]|nr:DedA family protein [Oligoflexia bacterium]
MEPTFLDQVLDKVSQLEGGYAYGTIFGILFACGMGLPVPEDITLVIAGYLSYLENIELLTAMIVCMVGVLVGDAILFGLGRIYGKRILKLPVFRSLLTPTRLQYMTEKFQRNSRKVCFLARFMAGLRAPTYLAAGISGVKLSTFLIMDTLAAIISVPLWVYLGFYFGGEIDVAFHYMRRAERYILLALALIGAYFILKAIFGKYSSAQK